MNDNAEDTAHKLTEFVRRKQAQHEKIVLHCRSLIATLKDRGCTEAAKDLDRLYFELDVIEGELTAFCTEDRENTVQAMLWMIERGKRK
jgi:hypothetical protein